MENVLRVGPDSGLLGGYIKSLLSARSRVACIASSRHGDGCESEGDGVGLTVYEL